MMLLTAVGERVLSFQQDYLGYSTIDGICVGTAKVLEMATPQMGSGRMLTMTSLALGVVALIAEYPGMDLPARLAGRLARIRAKHCALAVVDQTEGGAQ
jgi:hypothetical protein